MNYFDILVERKKQKDETVENLKIYLDKIKEFLKQKFKDFRVILFGSYVKNQMNANSDIDILIVIPQIGSVEEVHHLNFEIRKQIDFNQFIEIHIATEEEYNSWWSKFVKDNYIEY
ncbi:MAG: nucleotidyltransferase domain-containing protein [Endomicrobia bacterium]|nr:nucleotidyltransferase domain-containing protein [Endomicrobiia bacterium]